MNTGVGVSQLAVVTMGIWRGKGGLTTQHKDNQVRERLCEIAQSIRISNNHGAGPEQWDPPIDHRITQISDVASKTPHWKWFKADKIINNGQKPKAARHEFPDVRLQRRRISINETPTKNRKFVQVGIYFDAPLLLLLLLMMFSCRRKQRRNLRSQVFTDGGAVRLLDRFPCRAYYLYHHLCGSWHCWEEGGWKQLSAILMLLACGSWINTSDCFIDYRYYQFVNHECCHRRSPKPQAESLRSLGLLGAARYRMWSAFLQCDPSLQ